MSKTVDFIFDFASPNAYMTHKALAGITQRTGATVNYIPCLLGGIFKSTGNQAPFVTFANVKGKQEYNKLENERFIAKYNLTAYKMNPHFPMSTVALMRGLIVAEGTGQKDAYIEAVLKAMWEDGENMADNDVAIHVLSAAGLDGPAIIKKTQDPTVKGKLIENTEAAVARGAFGIPTFFVDGEMFFGKERLAQLEEEIAKA
ncbi:MAG: 2-hydroxychromene-2-carboxylate isomerase [Hyphomicrobiaceae bacterium]|jgi:2-hydroxychromene-2-carboxylate isomerase